MSVRKPIAKIIGKTGITGFDVKAEGPVKRTGYYTVIHEGRTFILNVGNIWRNEDGLFARLNVIGPPPETPFVPGSPVYVASRKEVEDVICPKQTEGMLFIGTLSGTDIGIYFDPAAMGRIFITGRSGSGKSYTVGVLVEELILKGFPVVIFDRHGEYSPLKLVDAEINKNSDMDHVSDASGVKFGGDSVTAASSKDIISSADGSERADIGSVSGNGSDDTDGDIIGGNSIEYTENREAVDQSVTGSPALAGRNDNKVDPAFFREHVIIFGPKHISGYKDLSLGYFFGADPTDVVVPGYCCIINMAGLDPDVQKELVATALENLYSAAVKRELPPFYVFIDEAHELAGQGAGPSLMAVRKAAQEGRKFNMNTAVITQRPQLLDVTVRSQSGTWIVHRLTDLNDIKLTFKSVEHGDFDAEILKSLDVGEAFIAGELVTSPIVVKIRKRYTVHGGSGTPVPTPEVLGELEVPSFAEKLREKVPRVNAVEFDYRIKNEENYTGAAGSVSGSGKLRNEITRLKNKNEFLKAELEKLKQSYGDLKRKYEGVLKELDLYKKKAEDAIKIAEKTLARLKRIKKGGSAY